MSSEPVSLARAGGFFWLMTIVTGMTAMVLQMRIGGNVAAHETLFRAAVASNVVATCAYLAATLFVYELLAAVDRRLSLLGAFFSIVGCALGGMSAAFDLASIVVLRRPQLAAAFSAEQVQALAQLVARFGATANNLALVFFGLHCVLVGVLIVRSSSGRVASRESEVGEATGDSPLATRPIIPRFVGALMIFGGIGWMTFLWQPLASALFPYIVLPGFIGESTLTLWLLTRGVSAERRVEEVAS